MYYLFIIKDNFFKNHDEFLYDILSKLKNMKKENYNYGISLYYNVCNLFNTESLKHYIKNKTNLKLINNKFYLDKYNYLEIRKSCCIVNKNIFICNFERGEYFWLKDKFK